VIGDRGLPLDVPPQLEPPRLWIEPRHRPGDRVDPPAARGNEGDGALDRRERRRQLAPARLPPVERRDAAEHRAEKDAASDSALCHPYIPDGCAMPANIVPRSSPMCAFVSTQTR